ncbi:MAG: diaminopimelate epimerase, partial [Terriglobia bacterium]
MKVAFSKYHGLGNDFVIIKDFQSALRLSGQAVGQLCDRHFGIGADGLIIVCKEDEPASGTAAPSFSMIFHNSDGSTAEVCGNGLRCVAKFLRDEGEWSGENMSIGTAAGTRLISLIDAEGAVERVTVDMGRPRLKPEEIPVSLPGEDVVGQVLRVDDEDAVITCVSMGNPHCVLFVGEDADRALFRTLGPRLETNAVFPERTNVDFVRVLGEDLLDVNVWERGAGLTLACGSGACAAVVAAKLNG